MASETSSRIDNGSARVADSMSFMDHLEELRRRLVRSLLVLLAVTLGAYAFRKDILDLVRKPVEEPLKKYTAGLVVKPSESKKSLFSTDSLNCVCQSADPLILADKPNKTTKAAPPAPESENLIGKWAAIAKGAFNDFVVFFRTLTSDGREFEKEAPSERAESGEIVFSGSEVVNLSCACKAENIKAPARSHSSMVYIGLPELFFAQMKAAVFAAFFLSFPYFLIEIWGFVGPALYRSEKKFFWVFAFFSYLFFIGGSLFGYFVVFPFGFDFFLSLTQAGEIMPSLSIGEYLNLAVKLLLAFGFIFELPLIAFILARLGVITPRLMIKQGRIAVLVIFIASAMLTPPDPFTMLLMSGPLLLLYVISIGVCYLGLNRQKAALRSQGIEDEYSE